VLLILRRGLSAALDRAETLRNRMLSWPPVYGTYQKQPQSLEGVVSEEMGYLD
jgi:beta-1,4-N-acetylglucosaminyltransferase